MPFFVAKPDESLVSYVDRGLIRPGRVLDLGCGPGRNAVYLASLGFEVDAVDLSPVAIAWAEDRAGEAGSRSDSGVPTRSRSPTPSQRASGPAGQYDVICDSGCFHHLPPHRRISYLALVDRVLAPGGHLALTCFDGGGVGGCELSDEAIYRQATFPFGGVGCTPGSVPAENCVRAGQAMAGFYRRWPRLRVLAPTSGSDMMRRCCFVWPI